MSGQHNLEENGRRITIHIWSHLFVSYAQAAPAQYVARAEQLESVSHTCTFEALEAKGYNK
jgi:hypothetical protein